MTDQRKSEKSTFDYRIEHWTRWAEHRGHPPVPALPEHIIEYIEMRYANGIGGGTINGDIYSISRHHRQVGEEDPVDENVKRILSGIMKTYAPSKIVRTITHKRLEIIKKNACLPRGSESPDKARLRGEIDIALISTMRDGLLRTADVKSVLNGDIRQNRDGSGILALHDPQWQDAYLSAETMMALSSIRHGLADDATLFELPTKTVYRRIRKAAEYAGLGATGYTADSPRLGMVEDLINAGIGMPAVMAAGRLTNDEMIRRQFKQEFAAQSAVARLYEKRRDRTIG